MGDNKADRVGRVEPSSGRRPELGGFSALMMKPNITAAVGALFGLGLGIVIGRATASGVPAREPMVMRPAPEAEEAAPAPPEPEPEALPTNQFRIQLGRRIPRGKSGGGFERQRLNGRSVARLTDKSVLNFEVEAGGSEYVVLAVLGFEGAKGTNGSVAAELDGRALTSWALEPGWNLYSAPVPRALLGGEAHELAFEPKASGATPVNIDGVAVIPVGNEVRFTMGEEAVGHLVEGFSNRSGRSVWSLGSRSVLGVALTPSPGPYSLTVRGSALAAIAPLSVSCKVNGQDVGKAEFERSGAESTWDIPAKVLRAGLNRVEFLYAKTAVPAELDPKSRDKRPLALRFAELSLVPE